MLGVLFPDDDPRDEALSTGGLDLIIVPGLGFTTVSALGVASILPHSPPHSLSPSPLPSCVAHAHKFGTPIDLFSSAVAPPTAWICPVPTFGRNRSLSHVVVNTPYLEPIMLAFYVRVAFVLALQFSSRVDLSCLFDFFSKDSVSEEERCVQTFPWSLRFTSLLHISTWNGFEGPFFVHYNT